jgi:hypothetical protein
MHMTIKDSPAERKKIWEEYVPNKHYDNLGTYRGYGFRSPENQYFFIFEKDGKTFNMVAKDFP